MANFVSVSEILLFENNQHYVKYTIVMRLFKVVVRFVNQDDFENRFSSDIEAYSYFEHLGFPME